MNKTATAALAAVSLLGLASCRQAASTGNVAENAASGATAAGYPIDGTWKTDLSTVKTERKPDQLMLQGGQFTCSTCVPPLALAADGKMHPVTGRPYADEISLTVNDDRNVTRVGRKNGHTTSTVRYSVSPDGKTLTVSFTDSSTPNTKPVAGSYTETRVAAGPRGAHAISGSWKPASFNNLSDEGLTATFREDNGILYFSTASGQSYAAKLDGSDTPIKGDIGGTIASVKKLAKNVYQETDKRGGKVIGTMTMTVGADGKMTVKDESRQNGSVTTYVATRQ